MKPHWQAFAVTTIDGELRRRGRDARVLEFGAGDSTSWLAQRCDNVVSIEHDPEWYAKVKAEAPSVDLRLINRPYYKVCLEYPQHHFDIVLVDGRNRKGCIQYAALRLKPGGLLLLDDAERPWYKLGIAVVLTWDEIPRLPPFDREEMTRIWRKPPLEPYEPPTSLAKEFAKLKQEISPHETVSLPRRGPTPSRPKPHKQFLRVHDEDRELLQDDEDAGSSGSSLRPPAA